MRRGETTKQTRNNEIDEKKAGHVFISSVSLFFVYAVVGLLRFYKYLISSLLPSACRFTPTCSEYAIEAVKKYGVRKGVLLALKRLSRCHPFCAGGYDPVR